MIITQGIETIYHPEYCHPTIVKLYAKATIKDNNNKHKNFIFSCILNRFKYHTILKETHEKWK